MKVSLNRQLGDRLPCFEQETHRPKLRAENVFEYMKQHGTLCRNCGPWSVFMGQRRPRYACFCRGGSGSLEGDSGGCLATELPASFHARPETYKWQQEGSVLNNPQPYCVQLCTLARHCTFHSPLQGNTQTNARANMNLAPRLELLASRILTKNEDIPAAARQARQRKVC
jgi:hypothetical protein